MKLWSKISKAEFLNKIFKKKSHVLYWEKIFNDAYNNPNKDYWDYQWTFACWIQNGLSILPSVNLISNIGFGANATHTKDVESQLFNMLTEEMIFPLIRPPFVVRDTEADDFDQSTILGEVKFNLYDKIKENLKKINLVGQ